jgi:short-subunit dehydrogenase involved in D-alanine esterification of teichoic acids
MKTSGNTILVTGRGSVSGCGLSETFHSFGLPEAPYFVWGDIG